MQTTDPMSLPQGIKKVVDGGYCIGCGACAGLCPKGSISMKLSSEGKFYPVASEGDSLEVSRSAEDLLLRICPFSDETRNEDELALAQFGGTTKHAKGVGRYLECFAGRIAEEELYQRSSSGGLSRWVLAELLKQDKVDYVVNVIPRSLEGETGALFSYAIHHSPEEVLDRSATSAYYPVELSAVLKIISETPGRYAITGVPCFVKALRSIAAESNLYHDRIKYVFGVICGHQKSTWYAEMLAWQLGVPPEELQSIDFRVKIAGAKANEKGVQAWSRSGVSKEGPKVVQEMFGTTYAHGFFKNSACEFCDDVTAELADASFGDAWLPEFIEHGTSLVVVRNPEIHRIILDGIASSKLELQTVDAERVEAAQAGGLRDRREGLSYRLAVKRKMGVWAPRKRVPSSMENISRRRRKIYKMRQILTSKSFEYFRIAKKLGDFQQFETNMKPYLKAYSRSHVGIWRLAWGQVFKVVSAIRNRFLANR